MRFFKRPKFIKYKKQQKGRFKQFPYSENDLFLKYGKVGLKSYQHSRITPDQIETIRRFLSRSMGRHGKIWFHLNLDIPITQKPQEVRMGKGKGNVMFWVGKIYRGKLFLEIVSPYSDEFTLLKKVFSKLPILAKRVIAQSFKAFD